MTRPAALVELPLGATEDRVVGTLDIERALKSGEKHFEPGLLAAAHSRACCTLTKSICSVTTWSISCLMPLPWA